MTYAQYGSIAALDYNTRESIVENVWGVGSGSYGWGQSALSTVSVGGTVSAGANNAPVQWAKLIQTLNNISTHEIGGPTSITQPITGNLVAWASQFDSRMNALCDTGATNNRFGNYTQFSDQLPISGVYTSPWTTTIGTTATVTWASANAARYFFNAGGRVNVIISYNGGAGTPQDNNWSTVCSNAGTMWVQAISSGGTSTNTGCGYYGSAGRMYSANGSGAYSTNTLTVDVAGQGTASLSFAVNFNDNHTNVWADTVTGTFTVTVLVRNPSTRGNLTSTWGTASVVVPNLAIGTAVPSPGGGGSPDAGGGLPSSVLFVGDVEYVNAPDTQASWTVPNGVSSVCVLMISGGGGGGAATADNNGQGAGGGGMLWVNDIPVTPGDVWTIIKPYGGKPAYQNGAAIGNSGGLAQILINNGVKGSLLVNPGQPGATGSVVSSSNLGKGATTYQINLPFFGSFAFNRGGDGGLGSPVANQRGGGGGGAAGYSGAGGNGASWTTTLLAATAGAGGAGGGGAATGTTGTPGYPALGSGGGGVGYIGQGTNGAAGGGGGSPNASGSWGAAGGLNGNVAAINITNGYGGGRFGGGGGGGLNITGVAWDGLWGAPGLIRIIWGTNRAYPALNVANP
jgi:hypothetical protein